MHAGHYVFYIHLPGGNQLKLDNRIGNHHGMETECLAKARQEFDFILVQLPKDIQLEMCLNGNTVVLSEKQQ